MIFSSLCDDLSYITTLPKNDKSTKTKSTTTPTKYAPA